MTILVCRCGRRIKAPGARPGRVGRCPSCGQRLEVAVEPDGVAAGAGVTAPIRPEAVGEPMSEAVGGYALDPGRSERPASRSDRAPRAQHPNRAPAGEPARRPSGPLADGLLPILDHVERGLWPSMLYPLRSAEATWFMAIMAFAFWIATILLPEYCLGLWADSNLLGTPSMGMLIILISVIPGAVLSPFVVAYFLQYVGRVLVTSARGDRAPPRTPDRNFEGFTVGLSPWLAWFVLGIPVGLLPLGIARLLADGATGIGPTAVLGVVLFGFPYAAVALMLSFLHERPLAASPFRVLASLLGHLGAFVPTLLRASAVLALAAGAAVLILALREDHFWLYVPAALGGWGLLIWASLVITRILGVCYYRNAEDLAWNRSQGRWGVRWRI